MPTMIHDNDVVLFQGDSITDAGRNYRDPGDLGLGYPLFTAAWFSALYPTKRVRFINRGISGNRAKDLRARWQADCLDRSRLAGFVRVQQGSRLLPRCGPTHGWG